MAYAMHGGEFGLTGGAAGPVANGACVKLKKLARRLIGTLAAQRQGEVEREIVRLLASSGGRLTDSLEREIMEKVFGSEWSLPQ